MEPRDLYNFYQNLFLLILLILFVSFFVIKNLKDWQFLRFLMVAAFFGLVGQIINFTRIVFFNNTILISFGLIFLNLVFYFLYLHYESLSAIKLRFWRYSLFYGLFIFCVALAIINLFNLYNDRYVAVNYMVFFGSIFAFICGVYSLKIVMNTYILTKDKAILVELISLAILISTSILYFIQFSLILINYEVTEFSIWMLTFVAYLLIMISLILILGNILINKEYIYHLPFPIHQIMVINNSGILAYVRKVNPIYYHEMVDLKDEIMSGVIRALTAMIQETLGKKTRLKYIDTGLYEIFFSQIAKKGGIIAIITSGGSMILQKSLDRFANSISDHLLKKLKDPDVRSIEFREQFDKYVAQAFPYLELKKNHHLLEKKV